MFDSLLEPLQSLLAIFSLFRGGQSHECGVVSYFGDIKVGHVFVFIRAHPKRKFAESFCIVPDKSKFMKNIG